MGNLCNKKEKHHNLEEIVDKLDIEEIEKNVIKLRYINELNELKSNSTNSTCIYNISNFFLTTLSIILPGIMSIQKINTEYEDILFWSSWGMSLGITLLNGYIKLFKIDRNYYFYNYNYERHVSEGWNYIELGGVYNSKDTHQQAYKRFMSNVEQLKIENLNTLYSDIKSSENIKKKKKKINGVNIVKNTDIVENTNDINTINNTKYMAINQEDNGVKYYNNVKINDSINDSINNSVKDIENNKE